jgi:AbrB family looped-hinge helix DNA binding protein
MLKSTVSSKGQITIPIEIRRRLGLDEGAIVLFTPQEAGALLTKGLLGDDPIDKAYGLLPRRRDSLSLLDGLRPPRPGGPRGARLRAHK